MKLRICFLLAALLGLLGKAYAVELSFNATYSSRYIYSGVDILPDSSFAPLSFTFAVDFVPTVNLLLGPTFSSGTFTAPDGLPVNYQAVTANTEFAATSFTPSPLTGELRSGLDSLTPLYQEGKISENESYEYYDRYFASFGAKAIAAQRYESYGDNTFYFFDLYTYPGNPPTGLNDVGHVDTADLLAYLQWAMVQNLPWPIEEARVNFNVPATINQRTGSHYSGTASLVAIDGVTAQVPEPATYSLLLAGLTLLSFAYQKRRGNR